MLIILLWMLVFALVHSFTADRRVKDWTKNLMGERTYEGFYRLFYNVLSVVMLAPVFLYAASAGDTIWRIEGVLMIVFRVLQLIGIIGLTVSILQIDWQRFAGLRQLHAYFNGDELPLPDEPLTTNGVYALVRHPLYLFSLMVLWFTPAMTDTGLAFTIGATLYFVFGSIVEEGRMMRYYPDAYETYRQRVPWLIPFTK